MVNNQYKEALIEEIKLLKKENAEIKEHIRPQTLETMNAKAPEGIIKKVTVTFFTKRIVILAVALAIFGGIVAVTSSFISEISTPYAEDTSINDPEFIPDTTENFNKTGSTTGHPQLAIQNDIPYMSDGCYIYKYVNGEKIVVTEGSATHLNAYKYCLYYYDTNDRTVYRIRTDGKEKSALIKNISVTDMKVYNNTLYALTEGGDIHKIYINGKNGYLFIEGENILSFTVTDGYIYYVRKDDGEFALYRTKISTNDTVKVSNTDTTLLTASEDYLFYIYNGTLLGLNKEEEKAHAFFADKVKGFILIDEILVVLQENALYTISIKGNSIEKIADGIEPIAQISLEEIISYGKERQDDK